MAVSFPPSRAKVSMQALLACLCTELGEAGWTGECCVSPGAVAWDACCDGGGMAWVRLISVFPTDRFPFQGSPVDLSRRDTEWAARIELGAVTCAGAEGGCAADGETADAVLGMAEAALRAIACCSASDPAAPDMRVAGLEVVGPQGMCAGFTQEVFVSLGVCCADSPC